MEKLRTLFGVRPHSWELLPPRKDDGVVRGPVAAGGGTEGGGGGGMSKNAKRRQKNAEKKRQAAAAAAGAPEPEPEPEPAPAPAPAAGDPAKRGRALQKKLRQIEGLKEKQAAGQTLEANQIAKIEGEAALRAELAALQ